MQLQFHSRAPYKLIDCKSVLSDEYLNSILNPTEFVKFMDKFCDQVSY